MTSVFAGLAICRCVTLPDAKSSGCGLGQSAEAVDGAGVPYLLKHTFVPLFDGILSEQCAKPETLPNGSRMTEQGRHRGTQTPA